LNLDKTKTCTNDEHKRVMWGQGFIYKFRVKLGSNHV